MQNLIYKTGRGTDITTAANNAVSLAKQQKKNIIFVYNDIMINVNRHTTTRGVINGFFALAVNDKIRN